MKNDAFFENARLLQEEMQVVSLLYGSLGLEYLKVYTASSKDGYRRDVKEKKDQEKIDLLCSHLDLLLDAWQAKEQKVASEL